MRKIELNYLNVAGKPYSYTIGGSGSQTTFTINNITYIANPGQNGSNAQDGPGGVGGSGGVGGTSYPGANAVGVQGASTIFGSGGVFSQTSSRTNGQGPGTGGAGGGSYSRTSSYGYGNGAGGGVRIYYS